jgi:hypothetical protein
MLLQLAASDITPTGSRSPTKMVTPHLSSMTFKLSNN